MTAFSNYAEIYDLLNAEKDYESETRFVSALLREDSPTIRTILNLGCGTGRHDLLLARDSFDVLGIELSSSMLAEAENRRLEASEFANNLSFALGDLRRYNGNRHFDAVISLFHVLSYQTEDDDAAAAFSTISRHMRAGSVGLFDLWHGPAVENMKPEVRVRRAENDAIKVTRLAEPQHIADKHLVNVKFTFFVEDKLTRSISSFEEVHPMRYFFPDEINRYIRDGGLTLTQTGEWMTRNAPSERTWSVYYLVEKEKS
ncbi:class I SAM-dependent DNA methyltransferase [Rhizobium sp. PAMB 3174]